MKISWRNSVAAGAIAAAIAGGVLIPRGVLEAQSAGPAIELDVMTFNIRTSAGRDGDNAWPYRKELVAETIRSRRPHVIGLQEALDDQIEYLSTELDGYRWLGIDRGLNGGTGLSEYTPIFYRYTELSPLESGTFWLSDTRGTPSQGRRPGRIVTWARFYHRESGHEVWVFNTHLSLRQGEQQVRSVERIVERVAALPPGTPVVVMGDFNAPAEWTETWEFATGGGLLRDAWVVADERLGPPVTQSGFGAPPEDVENRIDWILVGGPIQAASAETVVHSDGGRFPSDHFPVVARLRVPAMVD